MSEEVRVPLLPFDIEEVGRDSAPSAPISEPGLISKLLFTWIIPLFSLTDLQPESLPPIMHTEQAAFNQVQYTPKGLLKAIFQHYRGSIVGLGLLGCFSSVIRFLDPVYLMLLQDFIGSDRDSYEGYMLLVVVSAIYCLHVLIDTQYEWKLKLLNLHTESAVNNLLFAKTLKVESQESSGRIVNLVEVDTERVSVFFMWLDAVLLLPFDLGIATGLLLYTAGIAGLAGLSVFLVFLLLDIAIVFTISDLENGLLSAKDDRIDMAVTLLEEIKNWKMLGIDQLLLKKLCYFRGLELKKRKKINWLVSLSELSMWTAPSLAATAVFCTQVYLMGQSLDVEAVFPIIMTLWVVQESISMMPHALCDLIQGWVSAKRIESLLDEDETTETFPDTEGPAVSLKVACFGYKADEEVDLKDLTFDIAQGELIALVGPVGSGKSTLLDAMLGEVKLRSGEYKRRGRMAYAAGLESWIKNGTVRDNVLLGRPYNEARYSAVLKACALDTDISGLSKGDFTEIGERGINLSGGQKARLALARAVYEDVETYLFDDPLSSVDFKTCQHVFKHCIRDLLKGRTIVIATHALQYLSLFDRVLVLNDGCLLEQATPDLLTTDIAALAPKDTQESSDEDSEDSEDEDLVEDEESEKGAVSGEVYKTYFKYFGGYCVVFATFVVYFLSEASYLLGTLLFEEWDGDDAEVTTLVALFSLLSGLCGVFAALHFLMLTTFALKASTRLHDSMAARIVKAPVNLFFDVTPVGRILNRMSDDMEGVDEGLVWSFSYVMQCIISVVCTSCVCIYFIPLVICIVPFVFIVAMKLQRLYLGLQREVSRMGHVVQSPIISHLKTSLDGAKSIRCFRNQRDSIDLNQRLLDSHVRTEVVEAGAEIWLTIGMDLLAGSVLIFVSWLLILNRGNISPAVAGMCLIYLMPLAESINFAVKSFADLETSMVSVERIHAYTQVAQEASDKPALLHWPRVPTIEFRDVSVKYRPSLPKALNNVSFHIKAGEKVGVIGRTGSGKSTLTLVLTRILEIEKGQVLIDGVEIASLGLDNLRLALGVIPQYPVLFKGTLRENLDPQDASSDEEIKRLLDRIQFSYESLTDPVSDETLSSGQCQLICVLRAVLRKTKILLLDEATSAIDPQSEALVSAVLAEEFADSTVVTIAHRLSTVEHCSRLLVMERGQVKAYGKTKKILRRKDLASELQEMAADN